MVMKNQLAIWGISSMLNIPATQLRVQTVIQLQNKFYNPEFRQPAWESPLYIPLSSFSTYHCSAGCHWWLGKLPNGHVVWDETQLYLRHECCKPQPSLTIDPSMLRLLLGNSSHSKDFDSSWPGAFLVHCCHCFVLFFYRPHRRFNFHKCTCHLPPVLWSAAALLRFWGFGSWIIYSSMAAQESAKSLFMKAT